jgi:glucose-6-phosphate-specific signal transduction histidine kinase
VDEKSRLNQSDVRNVALCQKGILTCILVYIILVAIQFVLPENMRIFLLLVAVPVVITATVFVFLLATKVYGTGLGILLGILTLIPCIGFIVLLVVNGKATDMLKKQGIKVGLLGAKMSDLS